MCMLCGSVNVCVVWECECVCMSTNVYQTLCIRWRVVKGERCKLGDWDVDAVCECCDGVKINTYMV